MSDQLRVECQSLISPATVLSTPLSPSVWLRKMRGPWGEPVHFVQDPNMDGQIEPGGERQNVREGRFNGNVVLSNREHHFGILKRGPFKGPHGNPWERIFIVTYNNELGSRLNIQQISIA